MPRLTQALRNEYQNLFDTCVVRSHRETDVKNLATKLVQNKSRYQFVGDQVDVPWYIVAVIHNMESTQNFQKHLHNGDALTGRTHREPKNRPPTGNPPFTWEESAIDALTFDGLDRVEDWTLPSTLFRFEGFNGFGYRDHDINTPYLWSFSTHYTKGKFVEDGVFKPDAVSGQCGAALLLQHMVKNDVIQIPLTVEPSTSAEIAVAGADVPFSNQKSIKATRLQKLLNRFPGISTKLTPDGVAGKKTSAAFKEVTGNFLAGDPRTST